MIIHTHSIVIPAWCQTHTILRPFYTADLLLRKKEKNQSKIYI